MKYFQRVSLTIILRHIIEANCNNIETGETYTKVSNDFISVKIKADDPRFNNLTPESGVPIKIDMLLYFNIAQLFLDLESKNPTTKSDNWDLDENNQVVFYLPEHFNIIIESQLAEGFDGIDVEKLYNAFRHRRQLEEE